MILLNIASMKIVDQWIREFLNRCHFVEVVEHGMFLQSTASYRPPVILFDHGLTEMVGINGTPALMQVIPIHLYHSSPKQS